MELVLNREEVKNVLLEWAQVKFPAQFDQVAIDASYGELKSVTFSKKESE